MIRKRSSNSKLDGSDEPSRKAKKIPAKSAKTQSSNMTDENSAKIKQSARTNKNSDQQTEKKTKVKSNKKTQRAVVEESESDKRDFSSSQDSQGKGRCEPTCLIAHGYEKPTKVNFIDGDRMMNMSICRVNESFTRSDEKVDYEDDEENEVSFRQSGEKSTQSYEPSNASTEEGDEGKVTSSDEESEPEPSP